MTSTAPAAATAPVADGRRPQASLAARLLRDPLGLGSLVVLALVVLAAVLAPALTPYGPEDGTIADALAPASAEHWLGTDGSGRDLWTRLLFGARFSLAGAALACVVAVGVGALAGLVAGYVGRWFDGLASWVASVLLALPGLVVLLAVRSVVGPSAWWAMFVFGLLLSASVFRLVRATVQSVRGELYVDAARVAGLSDTRIVFRHVLRVVRAPLIIQTAQIASVSIAIQAGLEVIGLGDSSLTTWGGMLNAGFLKIYQAPSLVLWPALAVSVVCLALTLLANALRDVLEGSGAARPRTPGPTPDPAEEAPVAVHAGGALAHGLPTADPAAGDEDVLLRVERLRIGYAQPGGAVKEVVRGVSFDVRKGEVLGLIGESGSGKTQTAFGIMRLLPVGGGVVGGRVLWQGKDLAAASAAEMAALRGRRIAYVPQEPMSNLDPSFTIGTQMTEPLRHHLGLSRTAARARSLELLERVGIVDPVRVFKSYPHEVSGGMAQRVLIAGAISCNPELLIADEPTTALDVTVQAEVLELLRDLQADMGMGVVLVTHNFGVVADLCDRVAVMQDGLVVETGAVRDVFRDPRHPYTQMLFGAILSEDGIRAPYAPAAPGVPAAQEVTR